jgi:hypothetical protein
MLKLFKNKITLITIMGLIIATFTIFSCNKSQNLSQSQNLEST